METDQCVTTKGILFSFFDDAYSFCKFTGDVINPIFTGWHVIKNCA